jgi:hypothetical protein
MKGKLKKALILLIKQDFIITKQKVTVSLL